ncbi:MAG: glycine cleavage system aminomethyltransferase GcvT [Desulfovibrionaceae bacterium]|nr:glycine cleavage system aminomethyltransferase GcvT [Desulfovibrionaceae bacterium]
MADILSTPLTAWHEAHGAKMAPFAGWNMPIQYEGILAEHKHTRESASVFDICHMGEFLISGPGAQEALMKAVSHSLANLAEGRCRYGFILNEQGGVLDDCIIYHLGPDYFMVVVNAACCEQDFNVLKSRLAGLKVEDISERTAKIDLQGPKAVEVMEDFLGEDLHDLGYFAFRYTTWQGSKMMVSRTGYTGELGYELYIDASRAVDLWEGLLGDARVRPAGLGARDTLRMESGLALYGHELDTEHTPVEAGMGIMMKSEADYVGRAGLAAVREKLLPLELDGRRAPRHGDSIELDGKVVGRVTSGTFAPSLNRAIAFAWVKAEAADAGSYEVVTPRARLAAKTVSLPFYKQGTARTKLAPKA